MGAIPGAGKFVLALVIFGVVYFALPQGIRPVFALIIVLGALLAASNAGVLEDVRRELQ